MGIDFPNGPLATGRGTLDNVHACTDHFIPLFSSTYKSTSCAYSSRILVVSLVGLLRMGTYSMNFRPERSSWPKAHLR